MYPKPTISQSSWLSVPPVIAIRNELLCFLMVKTPFFPITPVSAGIEPIGWEKKGSLPGNSRTVLDCASGPAQSERDLSPTFHLYSRKIFDQERSGGQTPEWGRCVDVRCKQDYQRKEPLGNGVEGPGREHIAGDKEWREITYRGKIATNLAIMRYLAGD